MQQGETGAVGEVAVGVTYPQECALSLPKITRKKGETGIIKKTAGKGPREDMTNHLAGTASSLSEDLLASPFAQPTERCVRLWPRIHRRRHGAPLGDFHVKRTLQNYFCAL